MRQAAATFRDDRVLVQPKAGVTPAAMAELHAAKGLQVARAFPDLEGLQVVRLPRGVTVDQALAFYRANGLIAHAEPDYWVHTQAAPDDPRYRDGTLWNLNNTGQGGGVADADIDAPEGWDTLNNASSVVVAIVDSGVRATHEDLAANLWTNPGEVPGNGLDDDRNGFVDDVHGINALNNTGDPLDENGHGTHVAGIVGAVGNNGLGSVGVAWRVQLMACKFMDSTGNGSISDAIQCIDYARQKGAKVINASWGGPSSSTFLRSAIDKARQAGIIFVTAAGNSTQDNDATENYPSNYDLDNIVAVAATTRADALADYSNFGATTVDLAAPGSVIYSTWNSSDSAYTYLSGTSMATPHVTGAFALLRARFPSESYRQLIDRLLAATDPLAGLAGKCVTGGRLNLQKALGPALVADFAASPTAGSPPLTVNFTDQSQGAITSWSWDFGDGSAASTAQNPSHVFDREGNFTVTLTVSGASGSSSSKSRVIAAVANYQIQAGTFSWIDPSGMTQLPLSGDGVSGPQTLPFTFSFYGQGYSQLFVGANGLLGFVNQGLGTAANTDLPNGSAPNAVICPYWDDLDPGGSSSVRIGAVGTSPNRKVVVSWVGVPHRSKPPISLTFQVVLMEGSHQILFQYQSVSASKSLGAGRSATVGLENESGSVAAKYSFNGSALLANNQAILFVPSSSGGLSLTPAANLAASGNVGGPFAPTSQPYTIANTGSSSLNWAATKTQDWLELSAASGALSPGASTTVTVSLNASAAALPAGSYLDTVSFVNTGNGLGNTTRTVSLAVNGTTGVLTVTPDGGFSSSGLQGGPFTPNSQVYTLINTGDATLDWVAEATANWLSLSASSGTLAAGASATVTLSLNSLAAELIPGTYSDAVQFRNLTNSRGDTSRAVALVVTASPGVLTVTPDADLSASGTVGGPFSPAEQVYTLANSGGASLNWSASASETWLTLSATAGSLAPGQSADLVMSINANAASLPVGSYTATLTFEDRTSGVISASHAANLSVQPTPGSLVVTPGTSFDASGIVGGPFAPASVSYTLANAGGSSLDWTATVAADWLSLSATTGTLAPGASTTITVSINPAADALAVGTHSDTVRLVNVTNGDGNTSRDAQLTVSPSPGVLAVSPESGLNAAGIVGGPFTPSSQVFTLANTGGIELQWTAVISENWLTLSASAGTLAPGASATVTVSVNANADALPAGEHSARVSLVNVSNGSGNAERPVKLLVSPTPGNLTVSPETGLETAGTVGGPFTPSSQVFTLANVGGVELQWAAAISENWLTLSASAGTLAPGASATVAVSINANADALPVGEHSALVSFANVSNGSGNAERPVKLLVSPTPGNLAVSPETGLEAAGTVGGPFTPSSQVFTLANVGGVELQWAAAISENWLTLSASAGTLAPGASATVAVSINANAEALVAGSYSDTIRFENVTDGRGDTTRAVRLTVNALPGVLEVTPEAGSASEGPVGGPFSPSSQVFTVANSGGSALEWQVTTSADWLTLSAMEGTLAAGATTTITVSVNAQANLLAAGEHTGTCRFLNLTTGASDAQREVRLTVDQPARLSALGYSSPGRFELSLNGTPGRTYLIEATTDLVNWTPVSTNTTAEDGTFRFVDAQYQPLGWRYYRATLAP
ncbi:MAG: S8 family serine peptidase [Verrucomicrobia bacterium]|nr:S8 family serine peptidase [Verrucomicrobiota bacterium]